jgi:hypothetical protein
MVDQSPLVERVAWRGQTQVKASWPDEIGKEGAMELGQQLRECGLCATCCVPTERVCWRRGKVWLLTFCDLWFGESALTKGRIQAALREWK